MIPHYTEAIRHLEAAQLHLRSIIDPQKAPQQTSLIRAILSINIVKERIERLEKEDNN